MLKQLGQICAKKWQRFTSADRGVTAVEFVLVMPVIITIFAVAFETGMMFFTEMTLQFSVEDAARSIRTGAAQMGGLSQVDFKTKVCNSAGALIDCQGKVTVYVRSDNDFATLKSKLPPLVNIGPSTGPTTVVAPACYNPGAPQKPAIIVATYDWYFFGVGMNIFGNVAGNTARRLTAETVFLNQNYPGNSATACP